MQKLFIFSINRENNENQLYYSQIIVAVCKITAKAEKKPGKPVKILTGKDSFFFNIWEAQNSGRWEANTFWKVREGHGIMVHLKFKT